jgi:hypothetical protein
MEHSYLERKYSLYELQLIWQEVLSEADLVVSSSLNGPTSYSADPFTSRIRHLAPSGCWSCSVGVVTRILRGPKVAESMSFRSKFQSHVGWISGNKTLWAQSAETGLWASYYQYIIQMLHAKRNGKKANVFDAWGGLLIISRIGVPEGPEASNCQLVN